MTQAIMERSRSREKKYLYLVFSSPKRGIAICIFLLREAILIQLQLISLLLVQWVAQTKNYIGEFTIKLIISTFYHLWQCERPVLTVFAFRAWRRKRESIWFMIKLMSHVTTHGPQGFSNKLLWSFNEIQAQWHQIKGLFHIFVLTIGSIKIPFEVTWLLEKLVYWKFLIL